MFKSLEDVKKRWAERYQLSNFEWDYLPSPGCSEKEILELEQLLSIKIHNSFRWILMDVNLDTVGFKHYMMSNGTTMMQSLRSSNKDEIMYMENENLKQGFLMVTVTAVCMVEIYNATGVVYFYRYDLDPDTRKPIAQNMEEYICIAASIADHKWPKFEGMEHAIKVATEYVNEMGIKQGKEFWVNFIRGAA